MYEREILIKCTHHNVTRLTASIFHVVGVDINEWMDGWMDGEETRVRRKREPPEFTNTNVDDEKGKIIRVGGWIGVVV